MLDVGKIRREIGTGHLTLKQFITRVKSSSFARNFSIVFSGAFIAQLIGVALAPILGRIYDPAIFGIFGLFAAIAGSTGCIASLRYEQGIMLTDDERNIWPLQRLSIVIALIISCITAIGVAVALLVAPDYFQGIQGWVWIFGVWFVVFCSGLFAIFRVHASRKKKFDLVSKATVLRTLFTNGTQCLVSFWNATGLVTGALVGVAAGLIPYASLARKKESELENSGPGKPKSPRELAREYIDFPKYNAPQGLMNSLNMNSPIIVLTTFSPATAGAYLMTVRLMQRPMSMITAPLREVFFQHASEIHRAAPQKLIKLYWKTTFVLGAIVVLPAIVVAIGGPTLFEFVLGPKWTEAGVQARWVVLWLSIAFMNVPAVMTGRILRLEKSLMYYNFMLMVSRIAALLLGCWLSTPLTGVAAFCVVGCIFNALLILWVGKKTKEIQAEV